MTLIIATVKQYYTSEQDFYKKYTIHLNSLNWSKLKNNDIQLKDLKADKAQYMLDDLFTPYEQYLIAISQQNFSCSKCKNFTEYYTQIKINEVKNWFKTQSSQLILKSKKLYDIKGNITKTYFILNISGTHQSIKLIPQNKIHILTDDLSRLKWIEKHLQYMK